MLFVTCHIWKSSKQKLRKWRWSESHQAMARLSAKQNLLVTSQLIFTATAWDFDASCSQNEGKLLEGALGLPYRSVNFGRTIKEMTIFVWKPKFYSNMSEEFLAALWDHRLKYATFFYPDWIKLPWNLYELTYKIDLQVKIYPVHTLKQATWWTDGLEGLSSKQGVWRHSCVFASVGILLTLIHVVTLS